MIFGAYDEERNGRVKGGARGFSEAFRSPEGGVFLLSASVPGASSPNKWGLILIKSSGVDVPFVMNCVLFKINGATCVTCRLRPTGATRTFTCTSLH